MGSCADDSFAVPSQRRRPVFCTGYRSERAIAFSGVAPGFTLVELVVTMLVVGILSVVIVPKLTGLITFSARGFSDQVRAAVQHAQKIAIAQRRNACVTFPGGNKLTVRRTAAASCDTAASDPFKGGTYELTAPSGVTLTGADITFNAEGSQGNTPKTVTVTGEESYTITVEGVTGYVH